MTVKPEKITVTDSSGNIFADLDVPDAENEKLRLTLLAEIRAWVGGFGLTQTESAVAMGIKQPILSDAIKDCLPEMFSIQGFYCVGSFYRLDDLSLL